MTVEDQNRGITLNLNAIGEFLGSKPTTTEKLLQQLQAHDPEARVVETETPGVVIVILGDSTEARRA